MSVFETFSYLESLVFNVNFFLVFSYLSYNTDKHKLLQRFIPSEFGVDPYKAQISDMDYNFYSWKAEIRRLVEAEGIPYTVISCNFFMSFLIPSLVQPDLEAPPRDKATIFGDGNTKGILTQLLGVVLLRL